MSCWLSRNVSTLFFPLSQQKYLVLLNSTQNGENGSREKKRRKESREMRQFEALMV